ncbi:MAG TPA: VOC family protein [Bryobacteraceae bacterium]|jgi:catechol 2,3-dioxygenase-like lactoylglutathione lyase family enzyme
MLKSISRAVLVVGLGSGSFLMGQAPAAAKAVVTGTGSFTSFVENMDRSLAFYHDAFGMEVPALPASGQRPYNQANPQLFAMFDIAGAKERHQSARITGTRVTLEMMEIQEVPHQTVALRIQDPGAATVVFLVRDIESALARATQAKATVATPGGKPVMMAEGTRAILIRDLDGRFIELRQWAGTAAQTGDILDMRLSIAVKDMDEMLRAYHDVLGFTVEGQTPFTADAAMRSLTGLAKAEVRKARVQAPGSMLWIEFVEFKGVDRTPLRMRIQDRGAARLQLRVQEVDSVVAAVKAAGLKVMSVDGIAQPIPPNFKGALVADPNNFFLTPFAPCDACAPTIGGAPARATK